MTAPHTAPRPPSRWLFAAFAYALVTAAVTVGLSLQTPWLGLRLAPSGDSVQVDASQGPAAAIPAGAKLLQLRAEGTGQGHPEIALQAL
ncbi:MAG: hypothetical protein K2Q97_12210, partial [Burkholderiaceae bacterium]|nr:hypothetical protein [Burkholderiaceae bacterium]